VPANVYSVFRLFVFPGEPIAVRHGLGGQI